MFLTSKCRNESDLGLSKNSGLAKRMQLRSPARVPTSDEFCGQTRLKIRSRHCAVAFSLQVPKSYTDLDLSHSTFQYQEHIANSYRKIKLRLAALGVCLL